MRVYQMEYYPKDEFIENFKYLFACSNTNQQPPVYLHLERSKFKINEGNAGATPTIDYIQSPLKYTLSSGGKIYCSQICVRNHTDLIVTALIPDKYSSEANYYMRVQIDNTNYARATVLNTYTDYLTQMQGFVRIVDNQYRLYWSTSDPWTKGLAHRISSFNAINSKVGFIVDNNSVFMEAGIENQVKSIQVTYLTYNQSIDWNEDDNQSQIDVLDLALPGSITKQQFPIEEIKKPIQEPIGACYLYGNQNSTQTQGQPYEYLMGDTSVYSKATYPNFQNLTPPIYCNGTCTNYTLQTIEENPVYFNLSTTFDSFNLTNYYDIKRDLTTVTVYFVAQRPQSSRSNCPYIYEAFLMTFVNVEMVLPQVIPNITYIPPSNGINDPQTGQSSTIYYTNYREYFSIPLIKISLPAYTQDIRVQIISELYDAETETKVNMSSHGVEYLQSSNSIVINTTDRTYFGILQVKLVSRFSVHMPNQTFNTTNFTINIGECNKNDLQSRINFKTPLTYLVNSTKLSLVLDQWNQTIPYCGDIELHMHLYIWSKNSWKPNNFSDNQAVIFNATSREIMIFTNKSMIETRQMQVFASVRTNKDIKKEWHRFFYVTIYEVLEPPPISQRDVVYYIAQYKNTTIQVPQFNTTAPLTLVQYKIQNIKNSTTGQIHDNNLYPFLEIYNPKGFLYLNFRSQSPKFINEKPWLVTVSSWLTGYELESKVYYTYQIYIRHYCTLNVIQQQAQSNLQYEISDPKKEATLIPYKMNQSEQCKPITYSLFLIGSIPLPDFMLIDDKKLTLQFQTNKASDEKTYQIIMKGTTPIYNEYLSDIFTIFKIIIRCIPKKFSSSNNPEFTRQFYLEDLDPFYIEYKAFEIKPDCLNRPTVLYSATLKNGQPLPPYFQHLSTEQKFVITHDSISMHNPSPQTLAIQVTGQILGTKHIAYFNWVLQMKNLGKNNFDEYEKLDEIKRTVQAGSNIQIESIDFHRMSAKTSYNCLFDLNPRTKTIARFSNNVLNFFPKIYDSGIYTFYFYGLIEKTSKRYIQQVSLSIQADGSLQKKLTAKIVSISNIGEVAIRFSERIRFFPPQILNQTVLKVDIFSMYGMIPYDFNWTCKGFHENQTMILQLNISNPTLVSLENNDILSVQFFDIDLFQSLSDPDLYIKYRYQTKKNMPKQILNEGATKKLLAITRSLEAEIDKFMNKNCILNLGVQIQPAWIFNKMWRATDALQMTMLLPLMNVTVQGNIDVLYYVVNTYSNKPLTCGETNNENQNEDQPKVFFGFNNSQSYSQSFFDHDYPSVYLLENIRIIINNLLIMLYVTTGMCLAVFFLGRINILKKYAEIVKKMFVLNFIIKYLVDFSLRLSLFSIINLTHVTFLNSYILQPYDLLEPVKGLSFILSLLSMSILTFISSLILYKTLKTTKTRDLPQDNPVFSVLFDQLRLHSRLSALFYLFFLVRRVFVSIVLTLLKDYQAVQIHALTCQHFAFLTYLVSVRPFAEPIENYKLIMNELLSLVATLHMFVFSSAFGASSEIMSSGSWSFVGVFGGIMAVNVLVALFQTGQKALQIINMKFRLWRAKKQKELKAKKDIERLALRQIKRTQARKYQDNQSRTAVDISSYNQESFQAEQQNFEEFKSDEKGANRRKGKFFKAKRYPTPINFLEHHPLGENQIVDRIQKEVNRDYEVDQNPSKSKSKLSSMLKRHQHLPQQNYQNYYKPKITGIALGVPGADQQF